MTDILCNPPKLTVETIPERPEFFYITETVLKTTSATGETLEIMRTPNPLILLIKGERNEATIDLNPFIQEALLHVLRENDYSPTPAYEHGKTEVIQGQEITVQLLGSGWAAVHTVLVFETGSDKPPYWDIQNTGVGRYKTREEALTEARMWSQSDEIPLAKDLHV